MNPPRVPRPWLALAGGLLAVLAAPAAPAAADDSDAVVLRALRSEMQRAVERLRMDGVERPYLVQFELDESDSWSCQAGFGALLRVSGREPRRSVAVDVRVGDYALDNTNFREGAAERVSLPQDDDEGVIRHRVWLALDSRYKDAVEELAAKKAWLQTNSVPDRPDDLSRVEAVVELSAKPEFDADTAALVERARALSAVFRDFPAVQSSAVSVEVGCGSRTLLTSEGTRTRNAWRYARVVATASTQAADGMPLGDFEVWYGATDADLPPAGEMLEAVRAMAARLSERVDAPRAEEYIGPVLLEDEAACFAILELLIDRLSRPDEPLGSSGLGTPFKNRLKKRVAPAFLNVTDDPLRLEQDGVALLGAYPVDDDGVPAMPLELVADGRLLSWYMSRVPTRAIRETNGHSRRGRGGPGCVLVSSSQVLDAAALRAELLRLAREQDLPYAIRVASLARGDVNVRGVRASGAFRNGSVQLSPPVEAYRVYPDGREEPIRGAEWQGVTLRSLRDIFVTGSTPAVLNTHRGGFVSVVCPALLVEELEMKKPEERESKRPYLEHPWFARD